MLDHELRPGYIAGHALNHDLDQETDAGTATGDQHGIAPTTARSHRGNGSAHRAPELLCRSPERPKHDLFLLSRSELVAEGFLASQPTGLPEPGMVRPSRRSLLPADRAAAIAVPPVFLARLPTVLRHAPPGPTRKGLFIRVVLPLILEANRAISADRRRLLALTDRDGAVQAADQAWLAGLAARYWVDDRDMERLLRRVDTVPPSLALAQAAIESGWGASRFALQGNALFGQWTWKAGEGMTPTRRADGAFHAVKAFPRLGDSIGAYMLNLNRADAYRGFRARRAELRRRSAAPAGGILAETLERYSTERQRYVLKLAAIIRQNRLEDFDATTLGPTAMPGQCRLVSRQEQDRRTGY